MRTLTFVLCLGALVIAGCARSNAPANASGNVGLTDQQMVKAPGASTAPAAQAVPAETGREVATLYREGHELGVVAALGAIVGLTTLALLLTVGIPRPIRERVAPPRASRREERRAA